MKERITYYPWGTLPYYDYAATTCSDLATNLDGGVSPYVIDQTRDRNVMFFTGFGMPEFRYNSSTTSYQHGETVNSYRMLPREVSVGLRVNGCSREEYWEKRREVLDALRPNRVIRSDIFVSPTGTVDLLANRLCHGPGQWGPGTLVIDLPTGESFAVDALIQDGLVFQPSDLDEWDEWSIDETIQFYCPNGYVYNPNFFEFDITLNNNLTFANLEYQGTWVTYPVIEISGGQGAGGVTANPWSITNEYPDPQTISMSYLPGLNEKIVIELSPGNKSAWLTTDLAGVQESVIDNIFGYANVESNSVDFSSWSIGAKDDRARCGLGQAGDNRLQFSQLSGYNVKIKYYERFVGI